MDASSIVKLYLTGERGTEETRSAVDNADIVATSHISYAEVRSALARARRDRRLRTDAAVHRAVHDFDADWPNYRKVEVTANLVELAGSLAGEYPLSGSDAIHLASAEVLHDSLAEPIAVSTWDRRLSDAASAENFVLAHRRPA